MDISKTLNSKPCPWSATRPKRTSARLGAFALAALIVIGFVFARPAVALATPWLFVTDIHLRATWNHGPPTKFGDDTNDALFESAIREMQRTDPNPPVVVLTGDLLAHIMPVKLATPTSVLIAHRLNRAFPHAQFVLALGNNDSACGDYAMPPDSAYLRTLAGAWGPLVNRNGAAPGFARTFAHDGFYTARLPIPGLRVIVVDDVFWSPRYRGCGPARNAGAHAMDELDRAVAQSNGRLWIAFHIPPGVDAFSTAQIGHRFLIVPFLTPEMRDRFVGILGRAPDRIALAVAGHTHKFAFRIVDATGPHPVPMLLVPAVSPIFGNAPSFLTADVDTGGTLHDIRATTYLNGFWHHIGGMRSLGVDAFTGANLVELQKRLAGDPKLRATFADLYEGGAKPEITDRTWSVYWCAATAFGTTPFRDCDNAGGVSFLTGRGLEAVGAAVLVVLAAGGLIWFSLRRRAVRT
jgi:sphingomyelin phosphodiesterase acid-like 3